MWRAFLSNKQNFWRPVKQLSLRVDDDIHNQIARAAQKANKSINAWMVEILSEAAEDALGSSHRLETSYSEVIQCLVGDEQIMTELTEQMDIGLQNWNLRSALQFYIALNKLLAGLDAVHFFHPKASDQAADNAIILTEEDKNKLRHLAESLFYFLPEDDDPSSLLRFNFFLKKLAQGLVAVKPFFEQETVESTCNVIVKIADYLSNFQHSSRFTD